MSFIRYANVEFKMTRSKSITFKIFKLTNNIYIYIYIYIIKYMNIQD